MMTLKTFLLLFLPTLNILANPLIPNLKQIEIPDVPLMDNLDCGTCRLLVGMLQRAAESPGPAQEAIAAALVQFCETFHLYDNVVCQGLGSEYSVCDK
jgi:hypothetical protein